MNRLSGETSPYLLQHAHNPVHWYAWCPEAFEAAAASDKPILVSIGYSTCHWCHVMERESFEDHAIADFMNAHFINIKVDREERPDVDAIYMDVCQLLTGGGGWPLNCFLTPSGRPFYAGTYFPPRPAYQRPSWLQLLQHLVNIWETRRAEAMEQADKLTEHMRRNDGVFINAAAEAFEPVKQLLPGNLPEQLFYKMRDQFDRLEGGFGNPPKFPSTLAIQYLLHYHYFTGNEEALEHAVLSLEKMIQGGIYDQLGGGFARYATDREWLIPHFEKMLYDNALMLPVLADAWQLSGREVFRETLLETMAYLEREMMHAGGGFFSAQDADTEGTEGKFFVWQKAEIEAILGADADLFHAFYGVTEAGNWEHTNILWRPESYASFAEKIKVPVSWVREKLAECRGLLFQARKERVPPGLDDKVILGWNALMISGCTRVYSALGDRKFLTMGVRCYAFLEENLKREGQLPWFHVWGRGKAHGEALLDDYAYLIAACLDLYEATFEGHYLTSAEKYSEVVGSYFSSESDDLFFYTAEGQTDLIMRKKDLYDNATPSGNSTMVVNLQRLGLLLQRPAYSERARRMLGVMQATLERAPLAFERWCDALLMEQFGRWEIAVTGPDAESLATQLNGQYLPNKVVVVGKESNPMLPLLEGRVSDRDTYIYVCRNNSCQLPVSGLEAFNNLIRTWS